MYATSLTFDHASFRYHYLCHYLPLAAGMDILSRSLMKFKRGAQPDLDAWIDCARHTLTEYPPSSETILVRALGHRETSLRDARPTSLDLLCQTLARDFDCRYSPTLLSKTSETPANKGLSRQERTAQLLDVYSADLSTLTTPPAASVAATTDLPTIPATAPTPSIPFLLIDDILTTGATITCHDRRPAPEIPRLPHPGLHPRQGRP